MDQYLTCKYAVSLTITEALGQHHLMFYHPAWPADRLVPVCSLAQAIDNVNSLLIYQGRNFSTWNSAQQDAVARLMWVNWIYQRLSQEPIRKPILVHLDHNDLVVDCGDTRLMALSLVAEPTAVAVVAVAEKDQQHWFQDWQPVLTNQDLVQLSKFSPTAHVMVNVDHSGKITWLEIGDQTTSHHLHNIDHRVALIQSWINYQASDFRFSKEWARCAIDWTTYASWAARSRHH